MSGLIKGIAKAFKRVVKVVKKIAPLVIMAAAVYFSAGLALSAFPATSAFAASLPGFAGAAGAGTGIFSQVAGAIGMGSLGSAGGLAGAAAAAGGGLAAGAGVLAAPAATAGVAGIAAGAPAGAALTAVGGGAAAATGAAGAGFIGKALAAVGQMSFTDKLALAAVGSQALGALVAPSSKKLARDEAIEKAKFRGAFYGMDDTGGGTPAARAPQFSDTSLFPAPKSPTSAPAAPAAIAAPTAPGAKPAGELPTLAQAMTAPKLLGKIQKQVKGTSGFDLFGGKNAYA